VPASIPTITHEVVGLRLDAPASGEHLRDDFGRPPGERRLPYWARVWPSGVVLAELVAGELGPRVADRDVIELGCGLAAPGLIAARAGARVTLSDKEPEALGFAVANARRNGVEVATAVLAWERLPDSMAERFDVVLGADITYDTTGLVSLVGALHALLRPGGEAWLADPGRMVPGALDAAAPGADLEIAEARLLSYRGPLIDEYDDRDDPVIHVYRLIRRSAG
jgi:predicted nicotinamide N-methyase